MQRPYLWFLLVCAALVAAANVARADIAPIVGAIAVGGDAEERDRAAVNAGMTEATQQAGWQTRALSKQEKAGLLRCLAPGEPWACVPGTLDAQGIHHVLVVAAEKRQGEDGSRLVVLTAKLIVTRPQTLVVHQRFCEHCTDDKLTEASTQLGSQLVQELAVRLGRTVLEVKSVPDGARITLDGQQVGATDAVLNTYPGSHSVIVEKAGYLTQTLPVEAQEGKTSQVSVTLMPSATQAPAHSDVTARPAEQPSRIVPIALFAAGGAGLVGAGVLIYLGQQNGPDDRTEHRRATALGVTSGIAGLAAVGAGLYLWHRGSVASGPAIGATSNGTPVLGWARTF
jgi:hypothetical protein